MPNQNDFRQAITDQIIAALESGKVPPWRRPWKLGKNAGAPANVVSKRSYRGLNPILLSIHAEKHQLTSKWYGTFAQWRALGGTIMRRPDNVPQGQWGCPICFWSPITKTVQTPQGDEREDRFFVLRMYTVFCVDQVSGLGNLRADQPDTGEPLEVNYEPADDAIVATGASIRFGGGKAFYSPSGDYIQVPPKSTFESAHEFYATCFHELSHWSERRLNWKRDETDSYARYELTAEIASCFLSRELGVPASDDLTNHTAYLASWLQALRSDPRFIFMASAQASKAADFILSFSRKSEDVPVPDDELAMA
jgi:antirestriction protein ArdC